MLDFSLDLDSDTVIPAGLSGDSIHMVVDYGSATEVISIQSPFPIPPIPLSSYYDGIETLSSDHATGRHSFAIEHWQRTGSGAIWAESTYVCPCPQPPGGYLKLDQTTVFQLLHQPSK